MNCWSSGQIPTPLSFTSQISIAVGDARGDVDAALARELRRVVEQQEQDLVDLGEVRPDLRQRFLEVLLDRDRVVPDRVLHAEDRLLDDFAEIHVLDLEGHLALLDAPEVEDVLERSQERGAVVERAAQALLRGLREHVVLAGEDGDDRFDDAVQRRAQFARHLLDEIVLELLDLAEPLLAAQQLDVLREEGFGELQDLVVLPVRLAIDLRDAAPQRFVLGDTAGLLDASRDRLGGNLDRFESGRG